MASKVSASSSNTWSPIPGNRFSGRSWFWAGFFGCAWLAGLLLAWQLLAKLDFLYPVWYELLDIEQTIAEYGPQNVTRPHFQVTPWDERSRLFSELVRALGDDGSSLPELTYRNASGRPIGRLLTNPEITHLTDVSGLLRIVLAAGWSALGLWAAMTLWVAWRQWRLPRLSSVLFSCASALLIVALTLVAIGPVRVFYTLHDWVFPSGHRWFFFYQESLMTMLMKAPDIFAPIGIVLALTATVAFALLLAITATAVRYLFNPRLSVPKHKPTRGQPKGK